MAKRTGKFYRRNEREVMKKLGIDPTKNSGSGWVEKEDGQNDHIIAQLKSTDASSIRISMKDIDTLEYNASVAHKIPLFVVQFLSSEDVFLLMRPSDLKQISQYIETGECEIRPPVFDDTTFLEVEEQKPKVKSSKRSRDKFWEQKQEEAKKWKRK